MSNGENEIDESGRNPTQRRLDEEGTGDTPVDVEWEEGMEPEPGSSGEPGS